MKKQINILLVGLASVFMSCSDVEEVSALYPEYEEVKELSIVDKNATSETKALYSNLWAIQSKGFMFGHHDDLWYGRKWYNEEGRSDTHDVCGDSFTDFIFRVLITIIHYFSNIKTENRRIVTTNIMSVGASFLIIPFTTIPKIIMMSEHETF